MSNGLQNLRVSYPSVGLALRGLTKTRWNINLLPLNLRKKVTRFGLYLALSLSAVAVFLALTWMIHPLLQERKELQRVLAQLKEMKPRVDAIEAVQKNKDLLEKEVQEFVTLKRDETSKLEILRELSDILPSSVWIWNMKLKPKDIEINGFASSASDLIAILDKSPLFEKVEFSSPVTKERRATGDTAERERFRISAKIERSR
jgi:general secretion pathway protein L